MNEHIAVVAEDHVTRKPMDRRQAGFHTVALGAIFHHRRRGPRRENDANGYYVDRYDERLFAVTLGILLLCCLDAFFTLLLLARGAEEVNPIMATLLEHSVHTFVYSKLLMTAFGLVFLVVHATFWVAGTVRVTHLLYAMLACYVTLFLYQLDMLSRAF